MMQIVIEISEPTLAWVSGDTRCLSDEEFREIVYAFQHCIPLPKGHGKLKDVDKFNPCCKYRGGCLDEMCDMCSDYAVEYSDICNAPTIIEAEVDDEVSD